MVAFRPKALPTIFTLVFLTLMLGLGSWQLERLAWKEALTADLERQAQQPPGRLTPAILQRAPQKAELFQRFRVAGRYLNAQELFLAARIYEDEVGFNILTPFQLEGGQVLLVDRGWVPSARKDPASRPASLPAGLVEETLVLRQGGWSGYEWLKPVNDPENNVWIYVDPPAMAASLKLAQVVTTAYFQVEAPQGRRDKLPIGRPTSIELVNNHLEYALTWYALAAILLIFYVTFTLKTSHPQNN